MSNIRLNISLWSLLTWKLLLTDVRVRGLSENSPSLLSVCEAAVSWVRETRVWEAAPRDRTRVRWGKGNRRMPSSSVSGMRSGAASDSGPGLPRLSPRRVNTTSAWNTRMGVWILDIYNQQPKKVHSLIPSLGCNRKKALHLIFFIHDESATSLRFFVRSFVVRIKTEQKDRKEGGYKTRLWSKLHFLCGPILTFDNGWNCNNILAWKHADNTTLHLCFWCMKCGWMFTSEVATPTLNNTAHFFNQ